MWVDLIQFPLHLILTTSTQTIVVFPIAIVTKLIPTATHNVVAPVILLHPKFTLWTFFELGLPKHLCEQISGIVDVIIELFLETRQAWVDL